MNDASTSEPQPTRPLGRAAPDPEGLLRLYQADVAHADRVQRIAMDLFEATSSAHEMPESDAELVRASAWLHDLGAGGSDPGHGPRLVLQHGIAGYAPGVVADVARAVGLSQGTQGQAGEASGDDRMGEAASRAAALVAIADALDTAGAPNARVTYVDDTRPRLRVYVGDAGSGAAVNSAAAAAEAADGVLPRAMRLARDTGRRYYIRRGDTMQAAAYKVFARLYGDVRSREDGVRQDADIEDLHKFRVATRRLRAAFRAFRPVFGREALQEAAAAARTVARATNAARDLDVFIEALEVAEFTSRVPTLMERVSRDRAAAIRGTLDVLDGDGFDGLVRATEGLLAGIHPQSHDVERARASARVRDEAPRMVRRRVRRVLEYAGTLADGDDARLHDLRIAGKHLRYVSEFLADILADHVADVIDDMKALQDSLGEMNDCAVQRDYIERRMQNTAADGGPSDVEVVTIELLVAKTELRRERALSRFRGEWDRFTDPGRQRLLADRLGL